MLSNRAKKIICLDIDKNTITNAAKKYNKNNLIFQTYDGLNIPYNNNTFDIILSFQVIEHIKDDINYISEIYRVLKNGGLFILTTPNKFYRLKSGQKPWNKFHIREYYSQELKKVLKTKFLDIKIFGIRGNQKIQQIEIKRVKRNSCIALFNPLNLRKILPESLRQIIIKILKKIISKNKKCENKSKLSDKYHIHNFYVTEDDLKDNLDLLGICKKC